MRITKEDLENRASILQDLLDLGNNIELGISSAYGKFRIEAYQKDKYRWIEDITYLGTKKQVYEEISVAITVLELYKRRVELRKKHKVKK